ncbi:helix-turn-helix domain-containing protein [Herbaspirillum sp. RV1423]|uniref:helix-turn-helix domain-containing protein n=1 Tax=Herbaspirillum sp. RV1423 TaxID=1443993 RepID=UPI000687E31A|nr:helix-turn-helix transcriptional regulator [Herbaspirillum sp. RV1423]
MAIIEQLQQRRSRLGKTMQSLASVTGMSVPQVSNALSGKVDSRISTLEALADAMDSNLVLVPKHLLPEVSRLLAGKAVGPDDVPSTIDRLLGS